MKAFLLTCIITFLCSFSFFAQSFSDYGVTKEQVCAGAAISIAGNIKPWAERNLSFSETKEMIGDLVFPSIKDSPEKAYKLFKSGKNFDQVVVILKADFMKLDDNVVLKGLIKNDEE